MTKERKQARERIIAELELEDGLTISDLVYLTGFHYHHLQRELGSLLREKRVKRRSAFTGGRGRPAYRYFIPEVGWTGEEEE